LEDIQKEFKSSYKKIMKMIEAIPEKELFTRTIPVDEKQPARGVFQFGNSGALSLGTRRDSEEGEEVIGDW
jgi:hypothetical protein